MRNVKAGILTFLRQEKMLFVMAVIFIVFSVVSPRFLSYVNISNMLLQVSAYGITACTMMYLIIARQMDISVGAVMALSSIIAVAIINATGSVWLAVIASLTMGAAVGFINGLIVTKLKIDSFITTLATMGFLNGLAFAVSNGEILAQSETFRNIATVRIFGLPGMVIYFFIAIIISGLVLKFTTFGRNVCAVGGNPDVARYTGLKVNWYIITTFVMTSMVASFSGILISSRLNSSSPSFGSDAALQIISGVVLGGNSLNGGQGSAVKTFSGMMILALVSNALNMMNVYSYIQTLIKGLLLVAIVAADRFYQNRIK